MRSVARVDASVRKREAFKVGWAPCGGPEIGGQSSEESSLFSLDSLSSSAPSSRHAASIPNSPFRGSARSRKNAAALLNTSIRESLSQVISYGEDTQAAVIDKAVAASDWSRDDVVESSRPLNVDFETEIEIVSFLGGGGAADVYAAIWRQRKVRLALCTRA